MHTYIYDTGVERLLPAGTQFTCFTNTKVIALLVQKVLALLLQSSCFTSPQVLALLVQKWD